jgi:hypothetical protein
MKKLYTVKLETEIVVVADSIDDAKSVGQQRASSLGSDEIVAIAAHPIRKLPPGWDEGCHPYGDDHKSIKALVSEGAAPEYVGT